LPFQVRATATSSLVRTRMDSSIRPENGLSQ
jgi:hypothetical protein